MSRKETPDILGALMGETTKQESNNVINNKAIKPQNIKSIKKGNNKMQLKQLLFDGTEEMTEEVMLEEKNFVKEKATFNLSKKLLDQLEDKCYEIRKMSSSKQVTKTLIVEEAIKMAFAEFDLKKQISKFYCKLVSNN